MTNINVGISVGYGLWLRLFLDIYYTTYLKYSSISFHKKLRIRLAHNTCCAYTYFFFFFFFCVCVCVCVCVKANSHE